MSAPPVVEGFFDPATHTVTYLVSDPDTGQAEGSREREVGGIGTE